MKDIIFLVEEPSMEAFLSELLPRAGFDRASYRITTHEGKSDLKKSIPRKLRALRGLEVIVIILVDNDGADCRRFKQQLLQLCLESGSDNTIIRLVIQELEAWFLGNLSAVESAGWGGKFAQMQQSRRFRNPDAILKPSGTLNRLLNGYKKIDGARRIGQLITLEMKQNRSRSYNKFLQTLIELKDSQG